MKYIFVAGAPGSKWSSVIKNIYYSPSINRSDYNDARTYFHAATGKEQVVHIGSYFDPGMEFGDWFENINLYSKEQCEEEFNKPFSASGIRIIRSHVFSHHIDFLKEKWPECPVVLVLRDNDSCLGWWVRCGHFNITHPNYSKYYKNLQKMGEIIDNQNADIVKSWNKYSGKEVSNNTELAQVLNIEVPPQEYQQDYVLSDIKVKVI